MTAVLAHELMTLGVANARIGIDWERRPARYLTVDGVPAYQIGYSCGTCGLVLRREPGTPTASASVAEVRDRLNAGLGDLDGQVIGALSNQLPRGDYQVMLLDIQPQLVTPGAANDYFTNDGPAGWSNDELEYAIDPTNISYYRLGRHIAGVCDQLFEFAVPMTDPAGLDATTTARYATSTSPATAVAFGLLDIEGPWFRHERHWGLFHYLLDGHHKIAAAATAGRRIRLLTFVSADQSLADDEELLNLPQILQATNTERSE